MSTAVGIAHHLQHIYLMYVGLLVLLTIFVSSSSLSTGMASQPRRTLVLADSRGASIERALATHSDIGAVKVVVHRGAGYERTVNDSIQVLRTFKPDFIILFSGICDLTKRDRKTKITSLIHDSTVVASEAVIAALARALALLKAEGYKSVSVATLTGIDMMRYNGLAVPVVDHHHQEVLNSAILRINRRITDINKTNSAPTTWAASTIHAYYRGTYHFHYHKLRDGCHPREATNSYWARMMVKVIKLTK